MESPSEFVGYMTSVQRTDDEKKKLKLTQKENKLQYKIVFYHSKEQRHVE